MVVRIAIQAGIADVFLAVEAVNQTGGLYDRQAVRCWGI
jgi:hypothetical protein